MENGTVTSNAQVQLTLSELRNLVQERERSVSKLITQRARLQRKIESINEQIAELQGSQSVEAGSYTRAPHNPVTDNKQSLRELSLSILSKTRKGFTVREIEERALKQGYRSNSRNFRGVIYQTLRLIPNVTRQADGRYVRTDLSSLETAEA